MTTVLQQHPIKARAYRAATEGRLVVAFMPVGVWHSPDSS
jgi:hypothetical protein